MGWSFNPVPQHVPTAVPSASQLPQTGQRWDLLPTHQSSIRQMSTYPPDTNQKHLLCTDHKLTYTKQTPECTRELARGKEPEAWLSEYFPEPHTERAGLTLLCRVIALIINTETKARASTRPGTGCVSGRHNQGWARGYLQTEL